MNNPSCYPPRILRLILAYCRTDFRTNLVRIVTLFFAILAIPFLLPQLRMLQDALLETILFVYLCLHLAEFMKHACTRDMRIAHLLTPASMPEKFAARLVYLLFVGLLLPLLAMLMAKACHYGLAYGLGDTAILSENPPALFTNAPAGIGFKVWFCSLLLLAGCRLGRYARFSGFALLASIASLWILAVLGNLFGWKHPVGETPMFSSVIWTGVFAIGTLACLWRSYLIFSRQQLFNIH